VSCDLWQARREASKLFNDLDSALSVQPALRQSRQIEHLRDLTVPGDLLSIGDEVIE
jgi:hypothetical protein